MKFRYKVLLTNLILLSLALGLTGYLMIRRNFELAERAQIQNAIRENNLIQSSVEYGLLQTLNTHSYNIKKDLSEIGSRVAGSMLTTDSFFYIRYADDYVYSGGGEEPQIGQKLFDQLENGGKRYILCEENGRRYIYVTSCSRVDDAYLHIITQSDITESFTMMQRQIQYFRLVIIGILLAASAVMYLISRYLTRPLEELTVVTGQIADGHYDTRAKVSTQDEVGNLADSFNRMAGAVSEHVGELQDMVRRRDQFVADFTHEIKTPLTTMIGFADTMRSVELSREEEITALNYIFSEGKRLEEMSHKLFELIYLKQHEIEQKPVHVTDLGQEISAIVTPMLEQKHIVLRMDLESAVIMGSRQLLVTVFVNLIDNARKASKEGGVIEMAGRSLTDPDSGWNYYEWVVTDYGIGMTEEDQKRICDEFYMADKSRSRREGGAGIGMSLVALILEHHHALMQIESTLGEGTRIQIRFTEI